MKVPIMMGLKQSSAYVHLSHQRPIVYLALIMFVACSWAPVIVMGHSSRESKLSPDHDIGGAAPCNFTTDNPVLVAANGDSGSRGIAALLHKAGVFMATGGVECLRLKSLPELACYPSADMRDTECTDAHWDYHLRWDFEANDLMPTGTVCYPPDKLDKHAGAIRSIERDVSGVIKRYQRCHCPSNATGNRFGLKHANGLFSLPMFRKLYPRTSVVHLVRDGRDMAVGIKAEGIRAHLAGVLVGSGDLHKLPRGQLGKVPATLKKLKDLFCHAVVHDGHPACDQCLLECANEHVPSELRDVEEDGRRRARRLLHRHRKHIDEDTTGRKIWVVYPRTRKSSSGSSTSSEADSPPTTHKSVLPRSPFIACIASCSKTGKPTASANASSSSTAAKGKEGDALKPLTYDSSVDLMSLIPGGGDGLAMAASAKVWGVLNMQFADCAGSYKLGPEDYIFVRAEDFISKTKREGAITELVHRLGLPPPGAPGQSSMGDLKALFDLPVGDLPQVHGKVLALDEHYGKWHSSVAADLLEIAAWPALARFGYELSIPMLVDK
eukprot:jgi/Mesvir1/12709/Mv25324-RA.1